MRFRVECDEDEVDIPSPDRFPPLQGFTAAWRRLNEMPDTTPISSRVVGVASQRPVADLGRLSLVKFGVEHRRRLDPDDETDGAWPIPDLSRHVALMRSPELVVTYLEGPPLGSSVVEYAGVFKVDPAVEQAFADSEPPTHDDWLPENLSDQTHRRYVRIARRRIRELLDDFVVPAQVTADPVAGSPLGYFADQLGALLVGVEGSGGRVAGGAPGGSARSRAGGGEATGPKPRVEVLGPGDLQVVDGSPAIVVSFELRSADGSRGTLVRARPSVLLDGGTPEGDPPSGSALPQVIAWRSPDGSLVRADELTSPVGGDGQWAVIVSLPDDSVVSVALEAEVLG